LVKSKLQTYIGILCALVSGGPLKLNQLTDKVELDKTNLGSIMGFLYDHCLVGIENLDGGEKAYFVTERGVSVLKVVAPLVREAQRIQMRNFEAISTALSAINSDVIKKERTVEKFSDDYNGSVVSQLRRSKKDFEAYLKSLFDKDPLEIKYRNADARYTSNFKRSCAPNNKSDRER
jgi:DNA-binding transcriptional regulator GbsR (MarR family)